MDTRRQARHASHQPVILDQARRGWYAARVDRRMDGHSRQPRSVYADLRGAVHLGVASRNSRDT
jgi:hypothetical protein